MSFPKPSNKQQNNGESSSRSNLSVTMREEDDEDDIECGAAAAAYRNATAPISILAQDHEEEQAEKGGKMLRDETSQSSTPSSSKDVAVLANPDSNQQQQQQQQQRRKKCCIMSLLFPMLAVAFIAVVGVVLIEMNDDKNDEKNDMVPQDDLVPYSQVKLVSPTADQAFDSFGRSVALDGHTLVVGNPWEDGAGNVMDQGSVYVYTRASPVAEWVQEAQIGASDGVEGQMFGESVAISKDTLVVNVSDGDMGGARVFVRGTLDDDTVVWHKEADLVFSGLVNGEELRISSLAIEGDMIAVGASIYGPGKESRHGSVYVFARTEGSTWSQTTKIALEGDGNDYASAGFGATVDISGKTLLVGDSRMTTGSKAYVYVLLDDDTWTRQAILSTSEEVNYDSGNMAIDGDTIVIGVRSHDVEGNGEDSGAAYIFTREETSWRFESKVVPEEGHTYDHFGDSVAISGDMVIVGSDGHDKNGANSGAVFVYTKEGELWTEKTQVVAAAAVNGNFGYTLDISGNTVAACAKDDGESKHACYVMDMH